MMRGTSPPTVSGKVPAHDLETSRFKPPKITRFQRTLTLPHNHWQSFALRFVFASFLLLSFAVFQWSLANYSPNRLKKIE